MFGKCLYVMYVAVFLPRHRAAISAALWAVPADQQQMHEIRLQTLPEVSDSSQGSNMASPDCPGAERKIEEVKLWVQQLQQLLKPVSPGK